MQTEFASNILFDEETVAEARCIGDRTVMMVLKAIDDEVKTIGTSLRATAERGKRG